MFASEPVCCLLVAVRRVFAVQSQHYNVDMVALTDDDEARQLGRATFPYQERCFFYDLITCVVTAAS
jgi:hypothetical protein